MGLGRLWLEAHRLVCVPPRTMPMDTKGVVPQWRLEQQEAATIERSITLVGKLGPYESTRGWDRNMREGFLEGGRPQVTLEVFRSVSLDIGLVEVRCHNEGIVLGCEFRERC